MVSQCRTVNTLAPLYLPVRYHLQPPTHPPCAPLAGKLWSWPSTRPPEPSPRPAPSPLLGRLPPLSFPPPPLPPSLSPSPPPTLPSPPLAAPVSGLPQHHANLYYYTCHTSFQLFVSKFAPMANCENSPRAGSNSYSSLYYQPRHSAR